MRGKHCSVAEKIRLVSQANRADVFISTIHTRQWRSQKKIIGGANSTRKWTKKASYLQNTAFTWHKNILSNWHTLLRSCSNFRYSWTEKITKQYFFLLLFLPMPLLGTPLLQPRPNPDVGGAAALAPLPLSYPRPWPAPVPGASSCSSPPPSIATADCISFWVSDFLCRMYKFLRTVTCS